MCILSRLNFNLQNIIFSFLNISESLIIFNLSKKIRQTATKFKKFEKNCTKILKEIYILKKIDYFTTENHTKVSINYLENNSILNLMYLKYPETCKSEIMIDFIYSSVFFILNYNLKWLNFYIYEEFDVNFLKEIVKHLDKEKYKFYLHFREDKLLAPENNHNLLEIFKYIKYAECKLAPQELLQEFITNKLDIVFLHEKFYNFTIENQIYFKSPSNHLYEYRPKWDVSSFVKKNEESKHIQIQFPILHHNQESIKKIYLEDDVEDAFFKKFDKFFTQPLKNLKTLDIKGDRIHNKHKLKIFQNVSKIIFSPFRQLSTHNFKVFTEFIENFPNFNNLEASSYLFSQIKDSDPKIFNNLTTLKVNIDNGRFSFPFDCLTECKNLKKLIVNQYPTKSNLCFKFNKFLYISNLAKFKFPSVLKILKNLLENNTNDLNNSFLEINELSIFHDLLHFLKSNNFNFVFKKISSLKFHGKFKLKDINQNYFNIFEKIEYLEIACLSYFKILEYFSKINTLNLIIHKNSDDDLTQLKKFVKIKDIAAIKVLDHTSISFMKFYIQNIGDFKSIKYLEIDNTRSHLTSDNLHYLNLVSSITLDSFKIKIGSSNARCYHRETIEKLKSIKGLIVVNS